VASRLRGDHRQPIVRQRGVIDPGARGLVVLDPQDLVGMEREDVGDVPRLAVADLDAQRRHQHQPRHAGRALHRHLGGNPATQRATDHHRVAGVELRQEIEIEVGQVVHRVEAVDLRRVAVPRMRGRDDAAVSRQRLEHRRVGIEALLAVEPEDRTTVTALDDLEPHVAHGHPATHPPAICGSRNTSLSGPMGWKSASW